MKKINKIFAMLVAVIMMFSMTATAFAAEQNGKITINNAVEDQTYKIYRIFDLESYDAAQNAFSYKINDAWSDFANSSDVKGVYIEIDNNGYVKWITTEANSTEKFAELALEYLYTAAIEEEAVATAASNTVVFDNLPLGCYLIHSTTGVLCSLTTTTPETIVNEKNSTPTVEKQVKEGTSWGSTSDASIGDVVEFQSTLTIPAGSANITLHDKMDEGLTFNADSVTVTLNGNAVDPSLYTVGKDLSFRDDCTFEVSFTEDFYASLTAEYQNDAPDVIVVSYTAVLNEKAQIGSTTGNDNETKLSYGEKDKFTYTPTSTTTTYTYQFQLAKTNRAGLVLNGAKFKLYDAKENGNEIAVVKVSDGVYRLAVDGEEGVEIEAGTPTIQGLDKGTYYLEETVAPEGYNKLNERVLVSISGDNMAEFDNNTIGCYYVSGGVQVINLTGAELPTTGGIGTTIFYILGGVLVIGAAVVLISKKRMSLQK